MSRPKFPIPRPTKAAAIRAAARRTAPVPPPDVLFARLVTACRTRDLEAVCLLGHLVVRGAREETAP